MAYYDKIANQWHKITGYKGGAFKKYVLNQCILNQIKEIEGKSILELGAGNGYFMPLVLQQFSGQKPSKIIISDLSEKMLALAKKHFKIKDAEYLRINVKSKFPLEKNSIDLILATMIFNEVSTPALRNAIQECHRALTFGGQCIITVLSQAFLDSMAHRQKISENKGMLTMAGSGGLQVPVVIRAEKEYKRLLAAQEFCFHTQDVYANKKVLNEKPGLIKAGNVPIATIYCCEKRRTDVS